MQKFSIVLTIREADKNRIVYNAITRGAAPYLFDLVRPLNETLSILQEAFDAAEVSPE